MKSNFDIRTIFQMSYPAMSVYEFYSYMKEKEVLQHWENSTIYFICQRPVIYFDELILDEGIKASIKQRNTNKEIRFHLPLTEDSQLNPRGEDLEVEVKFYSDQINKIPPLNDVAGFQLFDKLNSAIVWVTPERLIYNHVMKGLGVHFFGDFHQFLDYNVHYIGKAHDQKIWKRLKKHEKLEEILATEHPYIQGEFAPYEFVLIFLKLTDVDMKKIDILQVGTSDFEDETLLKIIMEQNEPVQNKKFIKSIGKQITNDMEADLINHFEPGKNEILYNNYPDISNGLKSVGAINILHDYLVIGNLKTKEGSYSIKTKSIYA